MPTGHERMQALIDLLPAETETLGALGKGRQFMIALLFRSLCSDSAVVDALNAVTAQVCPDCLSRPSIAFQFWFA